MKKISIRTDGNDKIGLGHVMRSIALANMLRHEFKIKFYLRQSDSNVEKIINEHAFDIEKIATEESFINLLERDEFVVLDGYEFDREFQKKIKEKGCLVACIDDYPDRESNVDVIINQAPDIDKSGYLTKLPGTRLLLGPDYVLLRQGFLAMAKSDRKIQEIQSILVCLGGSDQYNHTTTVLRCIIPFLTKIRNVRVVTGSGYRYLDVLRDIIIPHKEIEHFHNIGEDEMISVMSRTDLAIVSASTILLEALAMKCVVIAGYYVNNQISFYKGFLRSGALIGIDDFNSEKLQQALEKVLLEKRILATNNPIDGNSGKRILKEFLILYCTKWMRLRPATIYDSKQYFHWVNEPEVRQNSRDSRPISWDEHSQWFQKKLSDDNCHLYFFLVDDQPIGQVRFELENDGWLIGFSIDRECRGIGLAEVILKNAILELRKRSNLRLKAFVKQSNIISAKVFEKIGFMMVAIRNGYYYYTFA